MGSGQQNTHIPNIEKTMNLVNSRKLPASSLVAEIVETPNKQPKLAPNLTDSNQNHNEYLPSPAFNDTLLSPLKPPRSVPALKRAYALPPPMLESDVSIDAFDASFAPPQSCQVAKNQAETSSVFSEDFKSPPNSGAQEPSSPMFAERAQAQPYSPTFRFQNPSSMPTLIALPVPPPYYWVHNKYYPYRYKQFYYLPHAHSAFHSGASSSCSCFVGGRYLGLLPEAGLRVANNYAPADSNYVPLYTFVASGYPAAYNVPPVPQPHSTELPQAEDSPLLPVCTCHRCKPANTDLFLPGNTPRLSSTALSSSYKQRRSLIQLLQTSVKMFLKAGDLVLSLAEKQHLSRSGCAPLKLHQTYAGYKDLLAKARQYSWNLYMTGSSATELMSDNTTDIDVVVITEPLRSRQGHERSPPIDANTALRVLEMCISNLEAIHEDDKALEIIMDELENSNIFKPRKRHIGIFSVNEFRGHAKVPLLKIFSTPFYLGFQHRVEIEISCNQMNSVRNTYLLNEYRLSVSNPSPLQNLLYIVKQWAKNEEINDPYRNTLSSLSLTLMTIHYLQQRNLLPVLQGKCRCYPLRWDEERDSLLLRRREENHVTINTASQLNQFERCGSHHFDIKGSWNSRQIDTCTLVLFLGFLDYYGNHFRYDRNAVSIRQQQLCERPDRNRPSATNHMFYIEEPFSRENVAYACYRRCCADVILDCFRFNYQRLLSGKDVTSLLTKGKSTSIVSNHIRFHALPLSPYKLCIPPIPTLPLLN